MLTILFWNLNRQDRSSLVRDAVAHVAADIVCVAELVNPGGLEDELKNLAATFYRVPSVGQKLALFSRDMGFDLTEVRSDHRATYRRLYHNGSDFLLGFVHLISKFHNEPEDQAAAAQATADLVTELEARVGHLRTFLIGDFNLNPFDKAMNHPWCFNAMMDLACTREGHRTAMQKECHFFYNPMWQFLGDCSAGPSGTFYHTGPGQYGWNMLDQVLVRPAAHRWFDGVEILTSIGKQSLTTKLGRPNESVGSDHFPLVVRLK